MSETKITANVSVTTYTLVERLAEARDLTKSQVVREALRHELQRDIDEIEF